MRWLLPQAQIGRNCCRRGPQEASPPAQRGPRHKRRVTNRRLACAKPAFFKMVAAQCIRPTPIMAMTSPLQKWEFAAIHSGVISGKLHLRETYIESYRPLCAFRIAVGTFTTNIQTYILSKAISKLVFFLHSVCCFSSDAK